MNEQELAKKVVGLIIRELKEDGGIEHAFDYAFDENVENKISEITERVQVLLENNESL